MTIELSTATAADIPVLGELLTLLFAQEQEFQPNPVAQRRGLSAIVDNPDIGSILIARDQRTIIGMVSLLYTISTVLGGRVALLEDMVVAPHYRDQGIGSRLLSHAIRHAQNNGCLRMTLLTDADNQGAQSFYQRQGFELSAMRPMRLLLS